MTRAEATPQKPAVVAIGDRAQGQSEATKSLCPPCSGSDWVVGGQWVWEPWRRENSRNSWCGMRPWERGVRLIPRLARHRSGGAVSQAEGYGRRAWEGGVGVAEGRVRILMDAWEASVSGGGMEEQRSCAQK